MAQGSAPAAPDKLAPERRARLSAAWRRLLPDAENFAGEVSFSPIPPGPFHSITSSARASSEVGTERPSVLAVLRLMTSSNLVGCWTGRSFGFAPLRIRSTERHGGQGRDGEKCVGVQIDQLLGNGRDAGGVAGTIAVVDLEILAVGPPQLPEPGREQHSPGAKVGIALRLTLEHADPPRAVGWLRARRERPGGSRAADERDERAALHSITPSASASSLSGTWRPSALAVFVLMISSYLVGCSTGRSAGFSPLRMRPV